MSEEAWIDPIVEEVRKVRDEYAARFNYDLEAILEDLKKREESSGRRIVRYDPRRLKAETHEGAA